jgi:hypothetical protein
MIISNYAYSLVFRSCFGRLASAVVPLILCCVGGIASVESQAKSFNNQELVAGDMVLEVNEVGRVVGGGQTLTVVRGDIIKIIEAYSQNGEVVDGVNVVGFGGDPKRPGNDLGLVFDSGINLPLNWAISKNPLIYAIDSYTKGRRIGRYKLHVIEPLLRFAIVMVDGAERIIRPKQELVIKTNESFKVKSVATNIFEDDKKVSYRVLDVSNDSARYKKFEILFDRNGAEFAKIAVKMSN